VTRLALVIALVIGVCISARAIQPNTLKVTFNGLDISIDRDTGNLLLLSSPYTGVILESPPGAAGLLDIGYPLRSFLPMRLASRFSRAEIIQGKNEVVITWKALAPSRSNLSLPEGKIYAQVTIRAADDGRSVVMSCRIENKSSASVPQVLFPDLWGLKPFAGKEETRLRLARGVDQPFKEPFKQPETAPFYAGHGWNVYSPAGYYNSNALRWIDFGSLRGGVSIFQKKWGTEDYPNLLTHRSEKDPLSLRIAWEHQHSIEPGESWESGEFWITPHPGGWAKGIEVFRHYVAEVNPTRPLPLHVRDGLGFQTVFLMEQFEPDPSKAYFRFSDLPRVAQDAAQYGINEVVLWGANPAFILPIPDGPLGTREELVENIHKARDFGVNMVPFISVHEILLRGAERIYGVKPGLTNLERNWAYHSEMIPNFQPYYVKGDQSVWVPSANKAWLKDLWGTLTDQLNAGIDSLGFDEFGEVTYNEFGEGKLDGAKPDLVSLIEKFRTLARAQNAESTFSGELSNADSFEIDGKVLDYTWNWVDYVDAGPILNVLRTPRLNCNVEDSPRVVKKAFSDGLYLNVIAKKPDEANGSALISSQPEMANALKEVASLRKQFLPFFVEGTFIGDSVLSKPTSVFVRGYTLDNKLLMIVLNSSDTAQKIRLSSDLSLWLPSTKSYVAKYYDSGGRVVRMRQGKVSAWSGTTARLEPNELSLIEIDAE
jgi:hypothetical protein